MIYAFSSAKKRYEKTFVHIINNTLMRIIIIWQVKNMLWKLHRKH